MMESQSYVLCVRKPLEHFQQRSDRVSFKSREDLFGCSIEDDGWQEGKLGN